MVVNVVLEKSKNPTSYAVINFFKVSWVVAVPLMIFAV
jgi:hypothetical protein